MTRLLGPLADALRAALVVGAAAVAVVGSWSDVGVLTLYAVFALGARALALPRPYDTASTAAFALQGFGEALGAYDALAWFDRVVHVSVPFLLAPVLYIALDRLDVVPDTAAPTMRRHHWGIFVITAALGLAVGALWEVFEYTADAVVGTNLSEGNRDTVGDLLADAVGALAGGALLVVWAQRSWPSRRAPAPAR